jgi:hypothetical protein
MARTPHQALTALHELQTVLLRHSADTLADATRLLRKQNTDHALHASDRPPRLERLAGTAVAEAKARHWSVLE